MSMYIPSEEIKQPSFHADELGFVFNWKGHLLRGIYPDAVPQAKHYFDSGFVDEIVEKRLFPKTWISEFENEQFGLIIEHELIQPVTYATEWNSEMLKDAALLVLEIAQVGQKYGYDMIDCHKLNVMFQHNRPLYVDLGSFIPAPKGSSGWRSFASFLRSYYYILDVWCSGASQVAKRMMSPHVEMSDRDYYTFKHPFYRRHRRFMNVRLKIRDAICTLVNVGDNQIEGYKKRNKGKGMLVSFIKKAVLLIKVAPSQHLNRYNKRIKRMKLITNSTLSVSELSKKESIISVINEQYPDCRSITILNNKQIKLYEAILKKTRIETIYSVQENEQNSSKEYSKIKDLNVTSLCFSMTGGEILLRNRFPENRFASDLVIIPELNEKQNTFSNHNKIELLKVLMLFTKKKTIILTMKKRNEDLIKKMKDFFEIKEYGNCLSNNQIERFEWGSYLIVNALQQ